MDAIRRFDLHVVRELQSRRSHDLDHQLLLLNRTSVLLGLLAAATLVAVVLRRSPRPALRTGLALGLAAGATLLVRALVPPRINPLSALDGGHERTHGFPSGHAALAFAAALALLYASRPLGALALVVAIAVGISRIWLALHYPTDVAAGAAIGCAAAAAAQGAFSWTGLARRDVPPLE